VNRNTLGLVLTPIAGISLIIGGFIAPLDWHPYLQTAMLIMVIGGGLGLVDCLPLQNRFSLVGLFTKFSLSLLFVLACSYIWSVSTLSTESLSTGLFCTGSAFGTGLLLVIFLHLRFPFPDSPSFHEGTPSLSYCPSCGIELQRKYNPNACPSCSAIFKVKWMDRLPFK
jgi:hypothetical protein